jgi:tRNA/tmRNA/rRNA uracil-C5-methylase (TrmA/RlmC/RlmD family)
VPKVTKLPDRTAAGAAPNWLGRSLTVEVGPVAHGGHCVARYEGRVVFVRHALPGETAVIEITEDGGGSFCRADAVQILQPSAHRVEPPCPQAGPGRCGGCDFQHVSVAEQRSLKAAVVHEQLLRLAGLDRPVDVKPLGAGGLGWRRRIRFAVDSRGRLGLRVHRSHRIIELAACPLGAPGVGDAAALATPWPGISEVEVAVDDLGEAAVLAYREAGTNRRTGGGAEGNRWTRGRAAKPKLIAEQVSGPARLTYEVNDRTFRTQPGGFWQTHPQAAAEFTATMMSVVRAEPGERVLDLYAGSGLFTAALALAVGEDGAVCGLEADRSAVSDAAENLSDLPWAEVRHGWVTAATARQTASELGGADIVVLDPPRTGAGRDVMTALLDIRPRVIVYIACDPAALARDVRTALDAGWQLGDISAFDAFPMTHHVECIATLSPPRLADPPAVGDR